MEIDLENLLKHVHTEELKNKLIVNAVKKGLTDDKNYAEKAVQFCEKKGWFGETVKLAKKTGNVEKTNELYDKAIQSYEEKGLFYSVL